MSSQDGLPIGRSARACAPAPTSPGASSPSSRSLSSPFFSAASTSRHLGRPRARIPDHHGAAAVLALRDDALELAYSSGWSSTCIASRLTAGSSDGPFGNRPRQHHALPLEPEVVVERGRAVLLDRRRRASFCAGRTRRLLPAGSAVTSEAALLPILLEGHRRLPLRPLALGTILSSSCALDAIDARASRGQPPVGEVGHRLTSGHPVPIVAPRSHQLSHAQRSNIRIQACPVNWTAGWPW